MTRHCLGNGLQAKAAGSRPSYFQPIRIQGARTISFLRAFFHGLGPFDAHHHAVHIACQNQFSAFCKTALIQKGYYVTTTSKQAQEIEIFHFLCYRSQVLTDSRVASEQLKVSEKFVRHIGIWDTDAHEGVLWTCEHFSQFSLYFCQRLSCSCEPFQILRQH